MPPPVKLWQPPNPCASGSTSALVQQAAPPPEVSIPQPRRDHPSPIPLRRLTRRFVRVTGLLVGAIAVGLLMQDWALTAVATAPTPTPWAGYPDRGRR